MKYQVVRTEYRNSKCIGKAKLDGLYDTEVDAGDAIESCVRYFREHHDNDERIDWNIMEVYDDIGNVNRFEWDIEELN